MAKDTFYFPHDYNPRSDDKIKLLIRKHGMSGYGVFWSLVEDLYNNANALRLDCEGIAYDLRVDENLIKSIINDFDLFVIKDDFFGSLSVQRRLDERNQKSLKASKSAQKRWEENKTQCGRIDNECESNAIKESKGKEIKEKKEDIIQKKSTRFILPTLDDIKNYCLERKNDVDYEKWFNFYSAKGWMVGSNKMKDWKAAVRTWENNSKNGTTKIKSGTGISDEELASNALQGLHRARTERLY